MSVITADLDTALRVVVTPSQSSYFAGEPLSVTITITNTRSPSQPHTARTPGHGHTRSAHSVSSARLARPPTSPGLVRTPSTAIPKQGTQIKTQERVRKGLVGRGRAGEHDGVNGLKRRVPVKSLSVDILPSEVEEQLLREEGRRGLPGAVQKREDGRLMRSVPSSPLISSPLARAPAAPLPANHPHARKASVYEAAGDHSAPIPQSASASSFAISLDPIAESTTSAAPPTPSFPSPAPTPGIFPSYSTSASKSDAHVYPPRPPRSGQSNLGLGLPTVPTPTSASFPKAESNAELILYAYVHLTGTLALLPPLSAARSPALAALQKRKRLPRGGGSMDIGVASPQLGGPARRTGRDRRSASFAGSLWGLLSPPAQAPVSPTLANGYHPGHRPRAPSYVGALFSPSTVSLPSTSTPIGTGKGAVGLGLAGAGLEEEWDPEVPVPVLEVQPAMLAVDLSLGPGEERTYTYTVKLPEYLPPTFKGRTLKFSYQLSVGACRATTTGNSPGSNSRVMKVPIRVYNHVSVDRPQEAYDLVATPAGRPDGVVKETTSPSKPPSTAQFLLKKPTPPSPFSKPGTVGDLRSYALRLLQPTPSPINGDGPDEPENGREGELTGCREAVEILTRVPKKLSYDVNKDGVKVAVLTFMKSAWRLGETVLGVVELNERAGRARVLKLSAILEAHEALPSSLTSPADARQPYMRRVHAEHHASFILQTQRTTFALDIPPDASPAFQLALGDAAPRGGLEWKVRLCLLVAVAQDGARVKGMLRDGARGEWGSAWVPTAGIAPLERPPVPPAAASSPPPAARGWAAFFASTFMGPSGGGFHDGDEDVDEDGEAGAAEVDLGAGEEGWREMAVETVECEVPVKIWPGNTAFRPMDVVFDV
ncbi:Rgp1-domain-containing protein [Auriscalpium vulgare]|uniref:Rgp1-domain-containing protein n=1 Tax=Auriscalpium vulgare TaxID=40419 RepID=A0ACB8RPA1_9AGAM|nr:Rgp1-domain-containing protein [Auriscalpium vulgare]